MSDSFLSVWTVAHQAPLSMGFSRKNSPDKNHGVGYHALLQEIFPARDRTRISYVSCIGRQVVYCLAASGKPSLLSFRFFILKEIIRGFPARPMLRTWHFHYRDGIDSIPGCETEILQVEGLPW